MKSKRFTLNQEDVIKILAGAGIALGGALVTYLTEIVGQIDLGQWTPVFVAVMSIAINALRKLVEGKK
jgi:hypothetical protein